MSVGDVVLAGHADGIEHFDDVGIVLYYCNGLYMVLLAFELL